MRKNFVAFLSLFFLFFAFLSPVSAIDEAPKFIEKFDPTSKSSDAYTKFIRALRSSVGNVTEGASFSHDIPVLPRQQLTGRPTRFFEVVLGPSDRAVTLRIRTDNLYLEAYRTQSGEWFEFGRTGQEPLMTGSQPIGFDGNYEHLGDRTTVDLNRQALVGAAGTLATATTSTPGQQVKKALLVIIQMICESMRFIDINYEIVTHWDQTTTGSSRLSSRAIELENSWWQLSSEVLHYDQDPDHRTSNQLRTTFRDILQLPDIPSIIGTLGVILCVNPPGSGPRPRSISMRTRQANPVPSWILPGRILAEFFSMRVKKIDNENPGELYGTVTATDLVQTYPIYKVQRDDAESIKEEGLATLNGPSRALTPGAYLRVDFDLYDYDNKIWKPLLGDDEVSRDKLEWSGYDWRNNVYDQIQKKTASGKYGSVELTYAIMSNAAEALVTVILVNGDNESKPDVYGDITAKNSVFKDQTITLFKTPEDKNFGVPEGDAIPLLRSVLAIPMGSTLTISADLWDKDSFPDLSPNDQIAKGIAEFTPTPSTSSKQVIKGEGDSSVEVRVEWR